MVLKFGSALVLIGFVLWLWALFDAATTRREHVRTLPKAAWIAVIVIFVQIGAVAWFVFGRARVIAGQPVGPGTNPRDPRQTPTARPPYGRPAEGSRDPNARPRRPVGPDDDPTFLSGL
jgi:hypothetical protein